MSAATEAVQSLDLSETKVPETVAKKDDKIPTKEGLEEEKKDEFVLKDPETVVMLIPSDFETKKAKHAVTKKQACMAKLLKSMIEENKGDEKEFPLPSVADEILVKVVQYMKQHVESPAKEIEKPLKSANMKEVVSEWDAAFVDVPQEILFQMILAANYMDIKPLLDLCCAKVASMIKGKTPEQIRKTFNIQNDFTPEEEETLKAQNKWAEEGS